VKNLEQMGRLAFRVEGDLWVAYYAMPKTMKGAIFLASIQMAIVQDECAKQVFMALMRDAVSALLKDKFGKDPVWPDPLGRPAPSHERAGRA
jgi:hypothetical protein